MGLDLPLTLLMLLSGVMHASWNAMVKVERDRLVAFALIHGTGVVLGAVAIWLAPPMRAEAWWYLGPSLVLQTAYIGVLMLAYQVGDLSLVYPVARGSAPLVVTLITAFTGTAVPMLQGLGVFAISLGILSLAWRRKGATHEAPRGTHAWAPVAYALSLGLMIGTYTVLDGLGVRASRSPLAYGGWIFVLYGLPWIAVALWRRRGPGRGARRWRWPEARHWGLALGAGSLCFGAYMVTVWALNLGAAALVSALRETSVIFAALIGTLILKEPFGGRRVVAAMVVAAGVMLIRLG